MTNLTRLLRTVGTAGIALLACGGVALADGYEGGGTKDAPAAEGRKFSWSITLGATSDYVFRGITLSDEDPAAQGSIDIGYGIFYAGVWGSNLDDELGFGPSEIDVYAGIKPVLGPVTFDLGVIGYLYPSDDYTGPDTPGDDEYIELKAGASFAPFKDATLGATVYYSPEYQADGGDAWAVEGAAGYQLRQIGIFVPTISGVLGWQDVENGDFSPDLSGDSDYVYWNAGVALAVEKFTIDLRYWDTDIDENGDADELSLVRSRSRCPNQHCKR